MNRQRRFSTPAKQVGFAELNSRFELMAGSVGAGDFERGGGDVVAWISACRSSLLAPALYSPSRCLRRAMCRGPAGVGARPTRSKAVSIKCSVSVAGSERAGVTTKIHTPEFLMAGNVLRGNTSGALGECGFVTNLLILCKFALGMRVEVGSVAGERKHQKKLCVQARGGDVIRGEAGDGGCEGLL